MEFYSIATQKCSAWASHTGITWIPVKQVDSQPQPRSASESLVRSPTDPYAHFWVRISVLQEKQKSPRQNKNAETHTERQRKMKGEPRD